MQENIYYKGGDKKSLGVSSPLKKKSSTLGTFQLTGFSLNPIPSLIPKIFCPDTFGFSLPHHLKSTVYTLARVVVLREHPFGTDNKAADVL